MAYVGNTPADKTLKLEKQQFTTSATTSYTLSHSVSDPQDIALFINNVRQNPNSSYTVSGTALTLSAATASTDTMYCVFLGRAIGTTGIGAGEVTKDKLDLISDSTAGLTVKGDGGSNDGYLQLNCRVNSHGIKLKSPPHSAGATYTLTFPNSVSADKFLKTDGSGNLSFADTGGRDGTPNWLVRKITTDQSFSQASEQKITFNSELFDSDNGFDTASSNLYTIPSGEGGVYCINAGLHFSSSAGGNTNNDQYWCMLDHNGTRVAYSRLFHEPDIARQQVNLSTLISVSAGDTLGIYGYSEQGSGNVEVGASTTPYFTWFSGFRVA
tara:strand:- start:958 stop:1935 length:978 start_codon:yes stop_codon:yes gene_type:complete